MSRRSSRSIVPGRAAAILVVLVVVALAVGARAVAEIGGSSSPTETPTVVPATDVPGADRYTVVPVDDSPTKDPSRLATRRARNNDVTEMPVNGAGTGDEGTVGDGASDLTAADGYIPDGTSLSPFDDDAPAIANLDPDLRDAIQSAATDASADGVTMVINSGWRSATYQQELLDEAIVTYGSEEEARKWVDTPDTSNHVKGEAVDVGDTDADSWLSVNGSDYGLCQTYANEIWHFQLMTDPGGTCPAPLTDASGG